LHTLASQWTAKGKKPTSDLEAFESYLRDLQYSDDSTGVLTSERTPSKAEKKAGALLNEIMGPWEVLKPPVKPLIVTVRQLRNLRQSVVEMAADALKGIADESKHREMWDRREQELTNRLEELRGKSPVKKPPSEKPSVQSPFDILDLSSVQSPFDILDLSSIADELDPVAMRAHGEHLRHRRFARKKREYV